MYRAETVKTKRIIRRTGLITVSEIQGHKFRGRRRNDVISNECNVQNVVGEKRGRRRQ